MLESKKEMKNSGKFKSKNINENITKEEVIFPQIYEIKGCGSSIVNGLYYFKGICNDRPYYSKNDNTSLWYFYTNLFPSSYWCGWYISKSVSIFRHFFLHSFLHSFLHF